MVVAAAAVVKVLKSARKMEESVMSALISCVVVVFVEVVVMV